MSEALPILAQLVSQTSTVLILINHIKTKPGVAYGRDWYTPGGSAPEYYSSVRLNVWASGGYQDKKGQQFGHRVKVKLEKAKMSAPHATGEYDLYYRPGVRKDNGLVIEAPGIHIPSSWANVLVEEGRLTQAKAGHYIDTETGEKYDEGEMYAILQDTESELRTFAEGVVYPDKYK
jgi:hypothetical protein